MTPSESSPIDSESFDVPPERRPRSIAIIMDGNGRWAVERDLTRGEGHRAGADSARQVVEACGRIGIDTLTLYSFSTENWNRPATEVDALMGMLVELLPKEHEMLLENNVRFRVIGSRQRLSEHVLAELDAATEATAHCTGLQLVLALDYGSREELTDATRSIAAMVRRGELEPDDIDEQVIADNLYTAGMPDPDLLIRTAGEYRVSNYLLWQISYAELHITDCYWPDFGAAGLYDAVRAYASRDRRFGLVDDTNS
jgi:undecaprenyl diphosphate synthase